MLLSISVISMLAMTACWQDYTFSCGYAEKVKDFLLFRHVCLRDMLHVSWIKNRSHYGLPDT